MRGMAEDLGDEGLPGRTVEETGLGYAIGDEDRICRPVPGSLRPVPWQKKPMAQLLLSMEDAAGGVFAAKTLRIRASASYLGACSGKVTKSPVQV